MDSKIRTELVIKAIAGDHDAFSELYSEYRDELIRFIIKQGAATREDAEDVVSEAFTEAFEHIGELREPEHFGTWLHSIARYCYLGTVKKERKLLRVIDEVDSEQSDDSDDIADDTVILPDDYAENEQIKQMLSDTILSMKKEFQDVIFLYYYEDMSIKEIAERQSLSEGTVKSQLHYAKKTLRKKLEPIARKGGLFAAVPFGAMFNAIDLSGELSGAGTAVTVVTGGSAAVTGGSSGAAATVSSGRVAGLVTAVVLAGAVAAGLFFLPRMSQGDNKGEYTETSKTTFTKETILTEEALTTTSAVIRSPDVTTTPGTGVTTRRSVTDSTTRRTRTTTQSTERPQTQPVQQMTMPVEQGTQPPATSDTTGLHPDPETEGENIVASGEAGDKIKWTLDKDGVLTFNGSGGMPDYELEQVETDYKEQMAPWKHTDDENYDQNILIPSDTVIKKVIIKDGVTKIGEYAFSYCGALTSVEIPNSVTEIADYAFSICTGLADITIPDSVTSIGKHTFNRCYSLKSIIVDPDNQYYSSYDGVLYNKDMTKLIYCPEGKTSITFPDGVKSIPEHAFSGCYDLTSITIPDSVTSIGDNAFDGCFELKSITIPDSVTTIGDNAFSGCFELKSITIPDSVTSIGDNAFSYCSELKSITIPDSVTSIGDDAFSSCHGLTSITLPDSITSIGNGVFCNSGLTSITIPDSITSIGDNAFFDCDNLTSITIPDSVTSIGDNAFSDCDNLTSITIPDSVTSIGDYAFSLCFDLKSITIPDSVTSIGDNAFSCCYNLTSITIPDSVTSIGDNAFDGCFELKSITIPDSVTTIGDNAFSYCSELKSITVNPNNEKYSSLDGVLYNKDKTKLICCPGAKTSITIPDSVTNIGYYSFFSCDNLTNITVNPNNEKYSSLDGVLYNKDKTKLICCPEAKTSVTIPNSVIIIGEYAFFFHDNLTSVTIPDSVKIIRHNAFLGCTNLSSITVPESVIVIGKYSLGYDALLYPAGRLDDFYLSLDFTLKCKASSAAEKYAKENGITCKLIK